ncbi:HIT family protein [Ornithinibacillus halotolerans]|uniref:HIT family protein n=1 Tax=Ornithinibacillus halotolerans TaxID=1274357 RepID=A0A916W708_9BACI|nr:HIT domain-containing protein [Ornithinibacillus halotolerans]GGA72548.1 HIT family protein [Ornithinibacillus halotolerans]
MNHCVFCHPELVPSQNVIFSNDYCLFLQLDDAKEKGVPLEGAGLIVPREHRETVFDLTKEEWDATYMLLQEVKTYIDNTYQPDGYNLGWNCGDVGGQHIFHAHFHVLPRYKDEKMAGKGIRYLFKGKENLRGNNQQKELY